MITIHSSDQTHVITSTRFPDGTSQVWKLPEWCLDSHRVVWHFEEEREVIDLMSLFRLLPFEAALHIPYLPYGRQDKAVANDTTFNLTVLADIINSLTCAVISSVDTHNPAEAASQITNFKNIRVTDLHKRVVKEVLPDYIVYPDSGARNRYSSEPFNHLPWVIFYKERDQATGEITGHTMSYGSYAEMTTQNADLSRIIEPGAKFLIVDDICDGGATFISVAKKLRSQVPDIGIYLFVTHGIFSKGREHLLQNGINGIYTTNSLLKNKDGYLV